MTGIKLKQILDGISELKGDRTFDEFFSDVKYAVEGYREYKVLDEIESYLDELGVFDYNKVLSEDELGLLEDEPDISSNTYLELLEAS